jgi:hypothetical protein
MRAALAVLVLLVAASCARTRVEGECEYLKEVKEIYTCTPGGVVDHTRVVPAGPP